MLDDFLNAARPTIYQAILSEALGQRIPQLNEPGWIPLGSGSGVDTLTGLNRREINDQVRYYNHTDPVMHHLIHLENSYIFSRGASVKAKDPDIDAWIQRFWKHPRNRASLTTAAAQHELNTELQIEGELFFIFYTSTLSGQVTVRTLSPSQIAKVIPAKGDNKLQQFFLTDFIGSENRVERYPLLDYRVADIRKVLSRPEFAGENTEIAVMHIMRDSINGRGISTKRTSLRWIKALTGFMEDRAVLTLAASTFAFKQKIKGNRQAVELAQQRWANYATQLKYDKGEQERRQGGNTFIENEASNLEQMKFDTMAGNAYQDMRMFRQQAGIGSGVFEHYMGDPSTGNLATATAMELPMLKQFEFGQQFWGDVFGEIFGFVVLQGIRYGKLGGKAEVTTDPSGGYPMWVVEPVRGIDLTVEAIFPPIVQKDVAVQANALSQIANAEAATGQQILPPEKKAEIALNLFGGDKDSGTLIEDMKANNFALPNLPQPPTPTEPVIASTREAEVGEPLPKKEAEAVPRITKQEVQQAVKKWEEMPSLDDLLTELGVTMEDVDA
ncbi:MAG: hypothetical protein K8L91_01655 [Anaerolineae bacterium]|nr:hypothetical protein [Anaerolineae bacterium]